MRAPGMSPLWWRPAIAVFGIVTFALIILIKIDLMSSGGISPLLTCYAAVVVLYLGTRAVNAFRYRPVPALTSDDVPTVAVVVPCYNEGSVVADTVRSILALNYPADRLSVVVVDDGSSDNSWSFVREVATDHRVRALRFEHNAGKRAAMAAGIRAADDAAIIAFVDSDTMLDADALRAAVAPFVEPGNEDVAAVTGHAEVSNASSTWLARLQQVRYFAAFRMIKAAESVQRRVICASGCFSVYRRDLIMEILPRWEAQTFLGVAANYGDDRALTTDLLGGGYAILYQRNAVSYTAVPETWPTFWKQQLRWKKSWTRESLRLAPIAARWSPLVSYPVFSGLILQIFGPMVLLYSILYRPFVHGNDPWLYLAGINAMAVLYGLMYAWGKRSAAWWPGAVYAILYTCIMSFQTYLAWFRLRDTAWGTRGTSDALREPQIAERLQGTVHASALVHAPRTLDVAVQPSWSRSLDPWADRYATGALAMAVLSLPLIVILYAL
ncbi:MAG TPA: glycosyltransferase family 2 protein [Actinomycetes bacterium]|nr:glycosyltransferase family 2 protein [Actinomycetes bacterium]